MKNKKKALTIFIVGILLCVVIIVGISMWNNADDTEKSQVTVRGRSYAGCGVIYSCTEDGCYIVTAGHIVAGMQLGEDCQVTFHDGAESAAKLSYLSDVADVAFLKVESVQQSEELQEFSGKPADIDKSRFDALKEGDEIYLCSGGENHTEKIKGNVISPWIYLEDFSLNMLLAKVEAKSGMSGCGVYDKKGYFVGILCGTSAEGEAAVLPLSVIESEWSMIVN